HVAELGDNQRIIDRRDKAAGEVRAALVDLRSVLTAFFGAQALAPFGFSAGDRTPSDPVVVKRVGLSALACLRTFKAPPARRKSMRFDTAEWIELLEKSLVELAAAINSVATDLREDQVTLVEKNRAIAAYDRAFKAT